MDPLSDKRRRYFTILEVAEYLGLGRSTVYDLVKNRRLRAHRFGRSIRISREEIERLERDSAL